MIQGNATEVVQLSMAKIAAERAFGANIQELSSKYNLSPKLMTLALGEMGFIKNRTAGDQSEDKEVELTEREKKFREVCDQHGIEEAYVNILLTDLGLEYKTGRRRNAISGRKYQIIYDLKLED